MRTVTSFHGIEVKTRGELCRAWHIEGVQQTGVVIIGITAFVFSDCFISIHDSKEYSNI